MFKNTFFLKTIYGLFVFLALSINAALTFQFGATHAENAFPFAGTMAFIAGGLFLTLFYDVAAWASLAAYQLAGTIQQRGVALWSLAISILASVISSGLQIALTNSLYNVPPQILDMASFIALIMMIFVASSHFLSIITYTMTSKEFQEEDAKIEQEASLNTFRLTKQKEMNESIQTQVGTLLAAEQPSLVAQEAQGQLAVLRSMLLQNPAGQGVDTPITIDHDDIAPPTPRDRVYIAEDLDGNRLGEFRNRRDALAAIDKNGGSVYGRGGKEPTPPELRFQPTPPTPAFAADSPPMPMEVEPTEADPLA